MELLEYGFESVFLPLSAGVLVFVLILGLQGLWRREIATCLRYMRILGFNVKVIRWALVGGAVSVFALCVVLAGTYAPLFAALVTGLAPVALRITLVRLAKHRLEAQILPLLYGIRAQMECGLAFPSAFSRTLQRSQTVLARLLRRKFDHFIRGHSDPGKAFEDNRNDLPPLFLATLLLMLQSYRRGLPVLQLTKRMAEVIEHDFQVRARVRELQRSARAQAVLAALMPLLVAGLLCFQRPGLVRLILDSQFFLFAASGGLLWQCLAWSFIRRLMCYV